MLVTAVQVREWLGTTSATLDLQITRMLAAAIAIVSDEVGQPVVNTTRIDRFYAWAERFVLSQVVEDTSTITVQYFDEVGDEQVVPAADYGVDATVKPTSVYFATVPTDALHDVLVAPVSVEFMAGLTGSSIGREAATEAVRRIVLDLFDPSNETFGAPTTSTLIAVRRLLAPYKRLNPSIGPRARGRI